MREPSEAEWLEGTWPGAADDAAAREEWYREQQRADQPDLCRPCSMITGGYTECCDLCDGITSDDDLQDRADAYGDAETVAQIARDGQIRHRGRWRNVHTTHPTGDTL